MNKVNFDKQMQDEIIKNQGEKKKLLLHSCCAPCFCGCFERLIKHFDLTVYFYNPNIDSEEEYNLRLGEQKRLCESLGINFIGEPFDSAPFYEKTSGLEREKEGGARCEKCFNLRLLATAKIGEEKGYDYFATTLTLSPLKNATLINGIGENLAKKFNIAYLPTDFKKNGGVARSVELSKEHNLYRQNYCGCSFSKNKPL